jgi:predicted O-methyltransferase YrrM
VRDGWSTLYILSALQMNGRGKLYSVDYPIRTDESSSQFKKEAPSYEQVVPTIPTGTDPGWIIPDSLQNRWNLVIGKSQNELPKLYCEIDEIDIFIHDSDHSLPCMIFEYELGWEWLKSRGIIFSDDILWNNAFDEFKNSKDCKSGQLDRSFGYIAKNN